MKEELDGKNREPSGFLEFNGKRIRDRLVQALRFDLVGPETPNEVLHQSPATRYLLGMLAPQGTEVDPAEDEQISTAAEPDESTEQIPQASLSLTPSAIGLSFVVDASC